MFIVSSSELFPPHCFSLRYFAASCALFLWCMCSPFWSLLWKGVGLYFLLSSLIPSHLSLRSRSLETDSRTRPSGGLDSMWIRAFVIHMRGDGRYGDITFGCPV